MTALHSCGVRHLLRHPAQLVLALVGLALGVGTIVAVEVATASSRRAFELSLEAVNGPATHQITGGPRGIDERLYSRLRAESFNATSPRFAPVLAGYVAIGERTMQLIGLDPFATLELAGEAPAPGVPDPTGEGLETVRRWLTEPGTVVMSTTTASELGLATGRHFELLAGGVRRQATLIALAREGGPGLDGVLLTDIAQAQEWLGAPGRLSRIDVRLPGGASGDELLARLRAQLPADLELRAARARLRETLAMTDAFTTNLKAMSLLALLVGAFLIYGAVSFAVLQRRPILAVLRALGATRGQVLGLVLGEAALLGLVGAVFGVLLGLALGRSLVGLVSQTINDLYFVVAVREVTVPGRSLLTAAGGGVLTALAAALLPALEVAASAPQLGLSRAVLETRALQLARTLLLVSASLAAGAGLLVWISGRSLLAGFATLFMLLLCVAALTPAALRALALTGARLSARLGPVVQLACRDIAASLSRTGVAVAALGMALTAMIGVAIMVQSFRESLREWLIQSLRADIYVSAPGEGEGPGRRLAPEVVRALLAAPGVRAHSESRRVVVSSPRGLIDVHAVRLAPESYAGVRFIGGSAASAWPEFARGAILISEPLAWRLGLAPHDRLALTTASGARAFTVAGVYREYGNERGEVLIALEEYQRLWDDDAIGGLGIYLDPGVEARVATASLRAAATAAGAPLFIRSNADIRALSMRIFERTFVITRVLYWLAAGVAAVGLVSALLAWELQRSRELAIIRSLGLTPGSTALLVLAQTAFMGIAALLAAIPAGLLTAVVLTDVINRRAFGWQIDLHLSRAQFLDALWLALCAALAAGAYPAWRSARAPLAPGMREE
jgi:putative ABC transport system permease protein